MKLADTETNPNAKKITPEQAVKILAEDGVHVTLEQAKGIIDFLTPLARMAYENALEQFKKEKLATEDAEKKLI